MITGFAAAAFLVAPLAHAAGQYSYNKTGQDGAWEVGTGTDDDGNAFCRIIDESTDGSFSIALFIYPLGNDPSFEIHAYDSSWKIPANTNVPTKFAFDDGTTWDSTGTVPSDGSSVVDYVVDLSNAKSFLNDFAQSQTLKVVYTQGTEPNWTADLTNTTAASGDLLDCANSLLNRSNSNGGSNPTQPFTPTSPAPPSTQDKSL